MKTVDYTQVFFPLSPVVEIPDPYGPRDSGRLREISLHVDLLDSRYGKPDCCVGHFGYNFYTRTKKAMRYEKYTRPGNLMRAVERALKKNLGLTVKRWVTEAQARQQGLG